MMKLNTWSTLRYKTVNKVSFVFFIHVTGEKWVWFVVHHAKVEQISIKSKTLKHDMYRTANFLSASEAKTRLIG